MDIQSESSLCHVCTLHTQPKEAVRGSHGSWRHNGQRSIKKECPKTRNETVNKGIITQGLNLRGPVRVLITVFTQVRTFTLISLKV